MTAMPKVRVVDALPEIGDGLDSAQLRMARRHLVAPLVEVTGGIWRPSRELEGEPAELGLLVLEGLLMRDVVIGETLATELVGRGDILRPREQDGQDAPIPFDIVWHVVEPARIALLDREFARAAGHWPEVIEAIVRSAVGRAKTLAITLAVSHLRHVDARVLVLMWYLADRWGKVRPDGIHVPVRLTHNALGRLVGAQRPSVTTALRQLADAGRVTRADDGTWLLHGDPPESPDELASARVSATRRR